MSVALQRHDVILRSRIEAAGGVVFKTGGDAFYAVFTSVPAAITAAVSVQQGLADETWPGPDLHVRAAIHTGEVEERDNDFFGPPMNRVARLLSAGHGDQILLSGDSYALARSELARGIEVRSLGTHRLKDLQRSLEIVQVVAPGLRSDFPALRTLDARRNNLPAQLTSFVGREREIADVRGLLGASRLVTLTGSGGTGKTRLALQVAADLLEDFGDGVWAVELAALTDPEGIPTAVAGSLGVQGNPAEPLLHTLVDFLRAKDCLLLLDNCEHLIDGCAALADALLRACPRLRILATSREVLGIHGEAMFRLPSLTLPGEGASPVTAHSLLQYEGVQLFVDRAAAVIPTFTLTDSSAVAVAEICARLDGMPLALELAAARVKSLSVEQIAARLGDRFRLLTGGSRAALPRQQTLHAAIDWSHELLTGEERIVLRRLSVFSAGWTLAAAEVVCGQGELTRDDVFDVLARLVDQSLVTFEEESEPRYRMLETIRQYASEKLLAAGEVDRMRGAHLAWCVDLAELAAAEFWSLDSVEWHERVALEHQNLRAALEWASEGEDPPLPLLRLVAALAWFWIVQGHLREGEHWTTQAETRSRDYEGPYKSEVLDAAGWLAAERGDADHSRELFGAALEAARQQGNERAFAVALWGLGSLEARWGTFEQARETLEEALAANRIFGASEPEGLWREVVILNSVGGAALLAERPSEAELYLRQAVDHSRQHGLRAVAAAPLAGLGELARARGDWATATGFYEEAMDIWREMGAKGFLVTGLFNLACVARNLGDVNTAAHRLSEVFDLERETGRSQVLWCSVAALAGVLLLAGRAQDGAVTLGAGQAHQGLADPVDRAEQEKDRDELIAALGREAFEERFHAGGSMAPEDGLRFAKACLQELLERPAPRTPVVTLGPASSPASRSS